MPAPGARRAVCVGRHPEAFTHKETLLRVCCWLACRSTLADYDVIVSYGYRHKLKPVSSVTLNLVREA